jgi:hypothetical protein
VCRAPEAGILTRCPRVKWASARELTQDFEIAHYSREGMIWDRQALEEGPAPPDMRLESHPESAPGERVPEFLKEEFSGLFN